MRVGDRNDTRGCPDLARRTRPEGRVERRSSRRLYLRLNVSHRLRRFGNGARIRTVRPLLALIAKEERLPRSGFPPALKSLLACRWPERPPAAQTPWRQRCRRAGRRSRPTTSPRVTQASPPDGRRTDPPPAPARSRDERDAIRGALVETREQDLAGEAPRIACAPSTARSRSTGSTKARCPYWGTSGLPLRLSCLGGGLRSCSRA